MYSEPKYSDGIYYDPRYYESKYNGPGYFDVSYAPMNSDNAKCPDASGKMPSCAPLAVPYVPFQQNGSQKYNYTDALNNGTLYPGLNLPFHLKVDAPNVVNGPLEELQALDFVVHELALYLDTHPDDTEAFELYKQYAVMAHDARMQYTAMFGPLMNHSVPDSKSYAWIQDPWPWNNTPKGWDK